MSNQPDTPIIQASPEFQKLFQRAKNLQYVVIAFEILLLVTVFVIPRLDIVGNWAFGIYMQFYWGWPIIIPLVPVLDIIALINYKHVAYRGALRFVVITLTMLLIGTLVYFVLSWTNFCCTSEGADLSRKVGYLPLLIVFLVSYVPKILQAWSLSLLSNKIAVQKKQSSPVPQNIQSHT